eukprot:4321672-Pyramimonas_sp.AAC.1
MATHERTQQTQPVFPKELPDLLHGKVLLSLCQRAYWVRGRADGDIGISRDTRVVVDIPTNDYGSTC